MGRRCGSTISHRCYRPATCGGMSPDLRWLPDSRAAARKFLFHLHRDSLRAVLYEKYEREPYVGLLEPSLRISSDHYIRGSLFPRTNDLLWGAERRQHLRGWFVLEVKYDVTFGYPTWLRRFLADHGVIREAVSKYWTCLAHWRVVASNRRARRHACAESPFRVRSGDTPTQCLIYPHSQGSVVALRDIGAGLLTALMCGLMLSWLDRQLTDMYWRREWDSNPR